MGLCILCTWLAFTLRLEELILFKDFNFYPALISILIAVPVFWLFGLYRTIFSHTSFSIIFTILISSSAYGLLYFSVGVYGAEVIPRSIGFFQPLLVFFAILSSRLGIKYMFVSNFSFKNSIFDTKNQFIACSGRLSFELVQKSLMANIGLLMGVGAPTSLAIDLAKRSDMTLIGFVKSDSFNIYCGENRILKTN